MVTEVGVKELAGQGTEQPTKWTQMLHSLVGRPENGEHLSQVPEILINVLPRGSEGVEGTSRSLMVKRVLTTAHREKGPSHPNTIHA